MLTTTPYLRIRRPSPTAAEFTVSTLAPPTLTLRLTLYAIYVLRGLLSGAILLFLYALWTQGPYGSFPSSSSSQILSPTRLLGMLLASRPGVSATRLAAQTDPRLAVPVCAVALYALTTRLYTEESLLVLRGLGIQTRSTKGNILAGRATTRFIPTEKIQGVLVNEAFLGFEVRSYLAVVVDGEPDVVVVFPKLLPRARVVERVWRGVRECLYEQGVRNGAVLDGKS
ncbi:GPI-GlcNAc transferase complex, PIG-H component-domain-containing protein [Xylaria bambusicola]|uniref:GPI-GlcNAc transferase complex, PIG-H component-domain-containing protein n=1 Tax=Xylaria bambusicola TaxID=326684 RepID=UPI0020082FB3|nr:GPI-GlcNAc transferase complex, PIG-H component-domain-containing protein [Xylaria bambusicola]KAI0513116.1 GPI-GlcNAc transferase complex, PIG-H component-domain-containing protein [Xylaria bambusicola]